jgi:two-component system, chemotaxis family, protein-glutamate methylesterase/glutaminase
VRARLRVVVVDDSAICRAELRRILEHDGDIQIVAEAQRGEQVLDLLNRHQPDLLAIDLEMPGLHGLETIEQVMAEAPLPILVITGSSRQTRQLSIFESVRRGALDLAEKPTLRDSSSQQSLRAKVRELARVPVVRHMAAPLAVKRVAAGRDDGAAVRTSNDGLRVVGIGASAGGPTALLALLSQLPAGFPACIAVVQHLPPGFVVPFADFLAERVHLPVRVAIGEVPIHAGTIYLAPDHVHLVALDAARFGPSTEAPVEGHRPSATVLLSSLARVFGATAAGVILSGIGRDGCAGLHAMKTKGALTIAQDEASCAVYGMPRAAIERQAATFSLDPRAIAELLQRGSTTGRREAR